MLKAEDQIRGIWSVLRAIVITEEFDGVQPSCFRLLEVTFNPCEGVMGFDCDALDGAIWQEMIVVPLHSNLFISLEIFTADLDRIPTLGMVEYLLHLGFSVVWQTCQDAWIGNAGCKHSSRSQMAASHGQCTAPLDRCQGAERIAAQDDQGKAAGKPIACKVGLDQNGSVREFRRKVVLEESQHAGFAVQTCEVKTRLHQRDQHSTRPAGQLQDRIPLLPGETKPEIEVLNMPRMVRVIKGSS